MRTSFPERSRNFDRLHPITKLYLTICFIVLSFALEFVPQLLLLFLVLNLAAISSERRRIFRRVLRYVLPVILLIILLNLIIYPESKETVDFVGVKLNKAGLDFGLTISLRLAILSLSLLFFFTTTQPHLLSSALLMKGVNPRIIYVFAHSLQLVDTLRRRIQKILLAQASRGLNVKGNLLRRLQTFFPLLLPLIFSYLSESLERGLALELRGLGVHGPKSFLIELNESTVEKIFSRGVLIGTALLILWKAIRWLIP